jgi:hypothetical protein
VLFTNQLNVSRVVFINFSAPNVFVSQRDFVYGRIVFNNTISNGLDWVTAAVDNYYPTQDGFVRGAVRRGLWRMENQPNGDLKITLIFQMDLGGDLPIVVVDLATLGLPKTM